MTGLPLFDRTVNRLAERGIPSAVIGGAAMAAHGYPRNTEDVDLLVADPRVLSPEFWSGLEEFEPEIRLGDQEDPLAGVVRLRGPGRPVDVVVAKGAWIPGILERAQALPTPVGSFVVVDAADLVLLKLHAGGPQDLLDVRVLLARHGTALREAVEGRLGACPASLRRAWESLPA